MQLEATLVYRASSRTARVTQRKTFSKNKQKQKKIQTNLFLFMCLCDCMLCVGVHANVCVCVCICSWVQAVNSFSSVIYRKWIFTDNVNSELFIPILIENTIRSLLSYSGILFRTGGHIACNVSLRHHNPQLVLILKPMSH